MTFLIVIILGIVLIIVSLLPSDNHKELLKTGKYAEGIVFEQSTNTDTSSVTLSSLNADIVIRFTTEDKTWITGKLNQPFTSFYLGQYKVGQKVDVYYDPQKPSRFYVATKQSPLQARVLMFVVGLALLVYGFYQIPTD